MASSGSNAPPFSTRLIDGDVGVEIDWLRRPGDDNLARQLMELIGEAELERLFRDEDNDYDTRGVFE